MDSNKPEATENISYSSLNGDMKQLNIASLEIDTKNCNEKCNPNFVHNLRNEIPKTLDEDTKQCDPVIGESDREVSEDAKHHYVGQRSMSTPDSRTVSLPNLSARPKTFENQRQKIVTDSLTKNRLKRKESFLQSVANVFRKKTETHDDEPKYTRLNIQKPSPFPGTSGFLKYSLYFKTKEGAFKQRWCFLRVDFFISYIDEEYKNVEVCLPMDSVISAQFLEDKKIEFKVEDTKLSCFEIRTSTERFIFGSKSQQECVEWMKEIGLSLNCKLMQGISGYQRIGWLYVREGINGSWHGAWLLLSGRLLFYTIDNEAVHSLDLRKARCIILQETTEGDCLPQVLEEGPHMVIDCQKVSYYFQSWNLVDTEGWYGSIRQSNKNGSTLEDQQLYCYNVPVIVEKCINFIYLHGSLLTGIYRRTGNLTKSEQIISDFIQDAWATQLPSDTYSGYDVARALKKFFSMLTEPLISTDSQEELHVAFCISNEDKRTQAYQAVFQRYPEIHYNTLRMVLRHLRFITEYKEQNLMNSENLASIWGVTIMRSEVEDNAQLISKDLKLVTDLIDLSCKIFPDSEKERHHEMLVRKTWERHTQMDVKRPSNDTFRIWVFYGDKEGISYNLEVGLNKTAKNVCEELAEKLKVPATTLILEEVILNNNLSRPVHYDEKVLDVVLKWTNWEEEDRKDNYLLISDTKKYETCLVDNMLPAVMEVKFADRKTRSFQTLTFELSSGHLNAYKDTNKIQLMKSWNINDIEWYIGNQKCRNSPTKHTITFTEKGERYSRTEALPWFGNVLSFSSEFVKITWISSLWKEQYKKEFLPLAMEFLIKRCQENQK